MEEVVMERSQMDYDVYVGMDAGKLEDYVAALARDGDERLIDSPVSQSECDLKAMLAVAMSFGKPLLIVDVWGGFGALPALVAREMGVDVAHMASRKFRQAAESYGEDKYDAKDAFILADATRWRPQLVELVGDPSEAVEEVKLLTAARWDAVQERTRCYNRTHDLLQRLCPQLEALFAGDRLHARIALELLARYGGPVGFRRAGLKRCSDWAGKIKNQRDVGPAKVAEVFDAISAQTVSGPAASVAESQVRRLCKRVIELNADIAEIEAAIAERSAGIPATAMLRSMPGIGEGNAAIVASQIGDVSRFRSADALASYAGLAPRKRQSSKGLNKTTARKGGNRTLKNAIVQSVQIALTWEGPEKERYWKERAEGKKHKQAIRALARRRVGVIYAMLSSGSFYEPSPSAA